MGLYQNMSTIAILSENQLLFGDRHHKVEEFSFFQKLSLMYLHTLKTYG